MSISPSVTGGSGWTCYRCAAWVPYNESHTCQHPAAPAPSHPYPSVPAWPLSQPQGWRCPNCNSAHAPTVLTCPKVHGVSWTMT